MEEISKKLIKKSVEAFLVAIEIYNKPTIRYRVEGFALFVCNAWELMLKAHLINTKGIDSIYYKDNPNRTISLEDSVRFIFTNDKDPLRLNLLKIIELRNTSTHFITEEYEMVYVPLFQSCILNFNEKMHQFHNIDMTEIIPQNFLTLSVSMKALNDSEIIAKYPEQIATKLLKQKDEIEDLIAQNNANFAIRIDHFHYITKDKNEATSFVKVDKNAETQVQIIKELKDPNDTHKYTAKSCIEQIKRRLNTEGIELKYHGLATKFNNYHFSNMIKYYEIKRNVKFCYIHTQFAQPQYTYSQQAIDFLFQELKKDPERILDNIKK